MPRVVTRFHSEDKSRSKSLSVLTGSRNKVQEAARDLFRRAVAIGMTRRQAAEFVASSFEAGAVARQSPLARAVVEEECRSKTTALVMAIRGRNARRAA